MVQKIKSDRADEILHAINKVKVFANSNCPDKLFRKIYEIEKELREILE